MDKNLKAEINEAFEKLSLKEKYEGFGKAIYEAAYLEARSKMALNFTRWATLCVDENNKVDVEDIFKFTDKVFADNKADE